MIRFVDQSNFVGLNEHALTAKLGNEFEEVSNSQKIVIVLDDLERLIGFRSPIMTREIVLTSILSLIDKLEKMGQNWKYLVVFTGMTEVIDHITNNKMNMIDPRSIKGRLNLPELPLFNEDVSHSEIKNLDIKITMITLEKF